MRKQRSWGCTCPTPGDVTASSLVGYTYRVAVSNDLHLETLQLLTGGARERGEAREAMSPSTQTTSPKNKRELM